MSQTNPFEIDLDRRPANYQPLTPLSLLERSAGIYPDKTAIIHGSQRITYRDFWQRSLRLASALNRRGIGRGDTVSVMAPNTPQMLEAHFGVPMSGAVLNSQDPPHRHRVCPGHPGSTGGFRKGSAGDRHRRS